jgi:cysteine-rich repeat protein
MVLNYHGAGCNINSNIQIRRPEGSTWEVGDFIGSDSNGVLKACYSNANNYNSIPNPNPAIGMGGLDAMIFKFNITRVSPEICNGIDDDYNGIIDDGTCNCTGTVPIGGDIIRGPSNYLYGTTPTSWQYNDSATTSTRCKWKCNSGFIQDGLNCVREQCPAGMISYWSFDSSANPIKDIYNSNNGTNSGAVSVAGKVGNALSFNGVNNYAVIPGSNSLNVFSRITLSAWIKINKFETGTCSFNDPAWIITKSNTKDATPPYGIGYSTGVCSNGATTAIFGIRGASSSLSTRTNLTTGTWNHIVGTYNGSEMRIYLNGQLENTRTYRGTIVQNNCEVIIGRSKWDVDSNLCGVFYVPSMYEVNGTIDEVAIFNEALNSSDILHLYNLGIAGSNICSVCGNNITETGEECDDGNTNNADRCNNSCKLNCRDLCDYSGQIMLNCSGNNITQKVCGNFDSDVCLEFGNWTYNKTCLSNETCSNGVCALTIIPPKLTCASYNSSNTCNNSDSSAAKYDVDSYIFTTSGYSSMPVAGFCDTNKAIKSSPIDMGDFGSCKFYVTNCSCSWNNGCGRAYNLRRECINATGTKEDVGSCDYSMEVSNADCLRVDSITQTLKATWKVIQGDPNYLPPVGTCQNIVRQFPCPAGTEKLPFFGGFNFVLSIVSIALIYFAFSRKNK